MTPARLGPAAQAQAFAGRIFEASLATAELMSMYLGLRLGLYQALAEREDCSADELAEAARITPRYATEWLAQQAAAGVVDAVDPARYRLPAAHASALLDDESRFAIASLALLPIGGIASALPELVAAYASGSGVSYAAYGDDFAGSQEGLNKSVFLAQLPGWIESLLPEVHAGLSRPGACIADVGCGAGWSSIALALAYPSVQVDGFDPDPGATERARANAAASGVADRVRFAGQTLHEPDRAYDLVCVFDALHDLPRPVEVLTACRTALAAGGSVLVMEPNVADEVQQPAPITERFFYAVSVLHCLPVSLSEQPSAATGTVIRPAVVRAYAEAAGLTDVTELPPVHRLHRLYRLRPPGG